MITPTFKIEQDENRIIITIHAPYTNVKDTEIHVLDEDVRFYSAPYYLRLSLPKKVVENDYCSAKYDVESGSFVIILMKATPGEHFPNLDMLTSMLQAKKAITNRRIEVLSGDASSDDEEIIDEQEWFFEQSVEEETPLEHLFNQHKYGFANSHSGLGSKYEAELSEVAEIKNPDSVSQLERQKQKEDAEKSKFSDEHYSADFVEKDKVAELLNYKFPCEAALSSKNREQLKNLYNKKFLLDIPWDRRAYLGLADILYAYLYDMRITDGSHCVESPWNISRVSSTLSWFHVFDGAKQLVNSCIRRSLCYPFYRNWELAIRTFEDTIAVLDSEPTVMLKCFLDIHALFKSREPYYLLNQLYIEDYCAFIQQMKLENVKGVVNALRKAVGKVKKEDMGLDLVELETAIKCTLEEEMEEELSQDMEQVHLK